MGVRRQARESAIQSLFMCDALGLWDEASIGLCYSHFGVTKAARDFALSLAKGVVNNLVEIDSKISCASEHWSLNRMSRVDRTILRLATYEILKLSDVPVNVTIDEAIEIAKRYGSDNSPVFVNGVLDRVASSLKAKVEVVKDKPLGAAGTSEKTEAESDDEVLDKQAAETGK